VQAGPCAAGDDVQAAERPRGTMRRRSPEKRTEEP
jgi:hypothetical protein